MFCGKNWITALRVKVTVKGQNVNVCLDDTFYTTKHFVSKLGIVMHHYESNCHAKRLICYFQGQGHCKSSYDKKRDNFYCIFWTADPFATKLGLIVHYRKPEFFMEKWDCCVQGQRQSKISECQWMFFQIISSKLPNILLPNLVLWCTIMSQTVMQKDRFAIFKVKVTAKYDNFYCIFWNVDSFATKLGVIVHYHKSECLMEKFDCGFQGQGHSKISKY